MWCLCLYSRFPEFWGLFVPRVCFSLCHLGPESACCYSCNITLFWVLTVSGPSSDFPKLMTLFCKEISIYEYVQGKSALTWRFEMFWIVQSCLLLTLALLSHSLVLGTACWDMILLYMTSKLLSLCIINWKLGFWVAATKQFRGQKRTKNDNIVC